MALPQYVAPGQSYVTPEMALSQNAALASGGGPDLTSQLVGNLSGALKGELPADVKQLLQQEAAQNSVSNGVSGSQFANYQGLRTLGLTSLNRMQGAENSLVNPLLGPRPYYHPPIRPTEPPPPEYSGGFGNITPHYNVGPIQSGGGAPGRTPNPTLPDYQQGGGGTSTGNILNDLLSKYGPLGNSGSSPMGTYNGSPLDMAGLDAGFSGGYGINDQDLAQTTPGYGAIDNLGYADQPSPEVLAQQALYE